MKNNVWYLTKQRFQTIGFHTGRIVTFSVMTILFIVANLISLLFLNGDYAKLLSNIMIIVAACLAAIMMVVLTASMFKGEVWNNQVNLELRQGYKARQIYLARIISMVAVFAAFMVVAIVVNLITIGVKGKMDSVVWYHMFVTSLGWYALVSIVAISMTIFFCGFLNTGLAMTLGLVISLAVVFLGGLVGGAIKTSGNGDYEDNYAGNLLKKELDAEVLDFTQNQLGIETPTEWEEFKNSVLKLDTAERSVGENSKINYQKVDISNYLTSEIDWQTYYAMVSGDWNAFDDENPNNNGKDNNSIYINRDRVKDSNFNNQFAAFAALGPSAIKAESEAGMIFPGVANFFKATHDFFSKGLKSINYDNIENWNLLDGKASTDIRESGDEKYIDGRTGTLTSNEDFKQIVEGLSKSELGTKYPFLKRMVKFADAKTLSNMYNDMNNAAKSISYEIGLGNIDLNNPIYPVFAVGGNAFAKTNIQDQFKALKVIPAEFIFYRNLMYFISNAFDDMMVNSFFTPGQTIIGGSYNSYEYDSIHNRLLIQVQNNRHVNYQGIPVGKTELKYGDLPDEIKKGLDIKIKVEDYNFNPDQPNDSKYIQADLSSAKYEKSYKYRRQNSNWTVTKNNVLVVNLKDYLGTDYLQQNNVQITSSTNKMIVLPSDINNSSNSSEEKIIASNPWVKKEPGTVIANVKYDDKSKTIALALYDNPWRDNDNYINLSDHIIIKDSSGQEIKTNFSEIDDYGNAVSHVDNVSEGVLYVSSKTTKDGIPYINTKPVDGTFYGLSIPFSKSAAHKSAISWIYNPIEQLSGMFNGVNYKYEVLDNLYNSFLDQDMVGVNGVRVTPSIKSSKVNPSMGITSMKRNGYIEIVYVYYFVLESLFVFAGYWMYRKGIVS